jgi:integrase
MAATRLTARFVETAPAPAKGRAEYFDSATPGFALRVTSTGHRSWTVLYRHGGRARRMTLGAYPALPLADAREAAKDALRRAAKGEDPAAQKGIERAAETFGEVAEQYIERHAKREKRSWRQDQTILEKDVLPRFRAIRAKDITRRQLIEMLDEIVARGAPIQANRTLQIVRRVFNWAMSRDLLQMSPCAGIDKPASENQRDRVLTASEIRKVWAAFTAEGPIIGGAFKLRLVTAQRGAEVLAMRWDQVADGWWTIPAEVAKNGRAHRVPIAPMAAAILAEIKAEIVRPRKGDDPAKARDPGEFVFPSPTRTGAAIGWTFKALARIRKASGVDFVPHDLRRTAASLMTGAGTGRLIVSKLLNHVEASVTAVYDRHSYDAEKRAALEAWETRLKAILDAPDDREAEIVTLPPSAQRAA